MWDTFGNERRLSGAHRNGLSETAGDCEAVPGEPVVEESSGRFFVPEEAESLVRFTCSLSTALREKGYSRTFRHTGPPIDRTTRGREDREVDEPREANCFLEHRSTATTRWDILPQ